MPRNPNFKVTPAHQAIFDKVEKGEGNMVISAVAGSGKTSTIVEALNLIPAEKSVCFLAFNKKIAEELQTRVPSNVAAMTLNALGHRSYTGWRNPQKVLLESDKLRKIAKKMLTNSEFYAAGAAAVKLARFAKSAGLIPTGIPGAASGLVPDTVDTWMGLISHFDMDMPDGIDEVVLIDFARRILKQSVLDMDVIDFDDQLLMTFAYGVPIKQYDWVFVDEAQDLSPLQHELVARALRPTGRLVAVGDEFQSIYGFRGADSDSMERITERFKCEKLPLHVSYRCPQAVVAVAQKYVPHIQAHPNAPMGTVDESRKDVRDIKDFRGGDMVICRFNAPLVQAAYSMLRSRIPCCVLGREIGQGLLSVIKKLKAGDMKSLLDRLASWESKEVDKFMQMDKEDQAAAVRDKAETIRVFAESADTIPELESAIDRMFSDKTTSDVVTLATIHKSKGLEAERIFIINFDDMPCKWAKKDWQQKQELNLIYVAVTRAKNHLQFVVAPKR